jgi:hypothetical protein
MVVVGTGWDVFRAGHAASVRAQAPSHRTHLPQPVSAHQNCELMEQQDLPQG